VTVALAIKAIGGSVVATDRQQTEGELKLNWGKMTGHWIAARGSLVASGAGNGPYLDAIGRHLGDWFKDDNLPSHADGLQPLLQNQHEEFYRRYVLPFEGYQSYERPDYDLLIVASPTNSADCIWTTHKLVLNREEDFAAVGSGGTVARALLDKFHLPSLPLDVAINLATYVLWQVKQTVDGVGFETDMFQMRRGQPPWTVPRDEIKAMEEQFGSYRKVETQSLYYCLGGDLSPAQKSMWGLEQDKEAREKSIREFFEKLNAERAKKHQP
jgi:ATP-dependent protease HslVU (ClpYQ) peptidase subunit